MRRSHVFVAVLAAAAVAGCGANYGPTRALQAMPEASLPAPSGAVLLGQQAYPRQPDVEGPNHAWLGRWYCGDTSPESVLAYYEARLVSLGWDDRYRHAGIWQKGPFEFDVRDTADPPPHSGCTYFWFEQFLDTR
jgi:hypothetical protein